MEFWGIEVKAGEPLKVEPGLGWIIHLSQASLGESKKGKGNESVPLFLKFGDKRLVLGTLSSENFPQLSFDLVFEKEFELSHNWKNGSVYFCGYKTLLPDSDDELPDYSDSEEEEEEDLPVKATENGKPETKVAEAKLASAKANAAKPESSAKPKVKLVEPSKDDDSDEDSEDDDFDGESDDEEIDGMEVGSEDDEDEDDIENEETPKKTELGKKRPTESATKTPVSAKKAKLATPQKTDGKKGGHTATPYPSKQAGKKSNAQTPNSGGQFSCKSCTKSFSSDVGLQSHTKAKHSGAK